MARTRSAKKPGDGSHRACARYWAHGESQFGFLPAVLEQTPPPDRTRKKKVTPSEAIDKLMGFLMLKLDQRQ